MQTTHATIHIDTPAGLNVLGFPLGMFETNAYAVVGPDKQCTIVDPGQTPQPLLAFLEANSLQPDAAVLTHGHCDHIAGLWELRAVWPDLPILIHEAESAYLTDPNHNLSAPFGEPFTGPEPTGTLTPGQTIALGGVDFDILHTPGHSPGGVTLHHAAGELAIVGDTLFAGSIGRSDFPHSDPAALTQSLHNVLMLLPDATRILPGHGPATTLARERQTNPYLLG